MVIAPKTQHVTKKGSGHVTQKDFQPGFPTYLFSSTPNRSYVLCTLCTYAPCVPAINISL